MSTASSQNSAEVQVQNSTKMTNSDDNSAAGAAAIGAEYASSLADLTVNSKPLINMLTMLAEENERFAGTIVKAIETHLAEVAPDAKLPVLYLIDSIVKNVKGSYLPLFTQCIVNLFCGVFEKVNERTRANMYKLRQTWGDVFPQMKLYALDCRVNCIDPAWPITARPPTGGAGSTTSTTTPAGTIHVNPNFLRNQNAATSIVPEDPAAVLKKQQLMSKQHELLILERQRLELQLLATRKVIEEQERELKRKSSAATSDKKKDHISKTSSAAPTKSNQPEAPKPAPTGIRIAPVSSELIQASRRNRDPRLARLEQQQTKANVNPNNVFDLNVNIFNKSNTNIKPNLSVDYSNNTSKRLTSAAKSDKKTPLNVNNSNKKTGTKSSKNNSADLFRKSSKSQSDKKSLKPTIPAVKSAKKSRDSSKDKVRKSSSDNNSSDSMSPVKRGDPVQIKAKSPPKKTRRVRTNSDDEKSLTKDVDLRVLAPPPEKQPRITVEQKPTQPVIPATAPATKDVDLRPAAATKKRTSPEKQGSPAVKRIKSDTFDVLFGNEDVDLRKQAPVGATSPNESTPTSATTSSPGSNQFRTESPPPPPIISKISDDDDDDKEKSDEKSTSDTLAASGGATVKGDSWAKVKVSPAPSTPDKVLPSGTQLSSFEAVRAKLAEATKTRDKLGRPLLFSKKSDEDKSKVRPVRVDFETDSQDGMEDNLKIIMSQAQEQISNGSINPAQYNTLLKQLVQINENKKLQEAQRRESLGSSASNKSHIENLTPISDDELEVDDDEVPSSVTSRTEPSLSDTLLSIQASSRRQNKVSVGQPLLRRDRFGNLKPDTRFNRMPAPGPGPGPGPAPVLAQGPWSNNWNNTFVPPPRRFNAFPPTPRYDMPFVRSKAPIKLGSLNVSLPSAPYQLVQYINHDTMKSINIDRVPRMIRFYEDDVAVALMNWDDPREIGFQDGSRRICIDNHDTFLLHFNQPYTPVNINGVVHQIKFGSPTRELYIDGKFYEAYFGGAPILVPIDNKMVNIKLEGPPPQVRLGVQRSDLVAGQITLIIDAKFSHPIFLDAKPQKVEIDNEVLTVRFAESFKIVLINELPFYVEFGGLPKSILVKDRKHFIRFTVLPRGLKQGKFNVKNMGTFKQPYVDVNDFEAPTQMPPLMPPTNSAGMPLFNVPPPMTTLSSDLPPLAVPNTLPPLIPPLITSIPPPITTTANMIIENNQITDPSSGYQMEVRTSNPNSPAIVIHDDTSQTSNPDTSTSTSATPAVAPTINVNDLFEKLVASGILQGVSQNTASTSEDNKEAGSEVKVDDKPEEVAKPVSFTKPETLKIRQAIFITKLYKGMQCSSCGTRFPPEQTMKYSQHLDWHFRQNRRDRDSTRRPFSRKWYYDVTDWVQYEEIEDLEEREKNWFDAQQSQQQNQANIEATGSSSNDGITDITATISPNVAAGPEDRDAHCIMCHDRFDQFYDEEKEEWCLRNAVRVDGLAYHPVCYDDYKASLEAVEDTTKQEDEVEVKEQTKDETDDDKIIILEDDVEEADIDAEDAPVETVVEQEEETQTSKAEPDVEDKDKDKANVEDDDDDDDDVHIHEEPVELVVLNDDEEEAQFEEIGMLVKIKEEPISDNEDEIDVDIIEDYTPRAADNTQQSVISTIDGNVELEPTANIGLNKIRINISTANSNTTTTSSCNGQEVQNQSDNINENSEQSENNESDKDKDKIKTKLKGVTLEVQEPVNKGFEMSGLCCIM